MYLPNQRGSHKLSLKTNLQCFNLLDSVECSQLKALETGMFIFRNLLCSSKVH